MLRNVVCQRAGYSVLQQHFVGFQAFAVDGFDLRRVEVHGHNGDQHEHTEDDVENRDAIGNRQFQVALQRRTPGGREYCDFP